MKPARSNPQTEIVDWELFLRIKHPSLDPADISAALDIAPEESIAAGPQVSSSGVRRLHNETYWIARLATFSLAEAAARVRSGERQAELMATFNREELLALMGASTHDMSILMRLKRFEATRAFFERINRDGGSVTLIVDRGEREQPVVLNRCLAKLAELGIALEVD
jgi:hypothetical protein